MPTYAASYDDATDTSGWLTSTTTTSTLTGTTGDILWTSGRTEGTAATLGTAYYDTETSGLQVYSGNHSGGSDGWVTVDNSGTFGVQGNVVAGDTVTVQYTSDGVNIANPYVYVESAESKEARIKRHLNRQKSLNNKVTPQEIKARESLRDMLTEREWRRYVTNGFVLVRGLSGKFYQVFNDQSHIKVYVKGKLTDEICIHTTSDTKCPPTDHIINMMFLIQNDEQLIWTKGVGNVYNKDGTARSQGLTGFGGNIVINSDDIVTDAQVMQEFIAGGDDVPVEYVGGLTKNFSGVTKKISLVETYKKLKAA